MALHADGGLADGDHQKFFLAAGPTADELPLAIDSADVDTNGVIYAGKGSTLYKSTNGGASFTTLWTVPGSQLQVRRVFCDSRDYVYVSGYGGTDYGLYRSTDAGANFTKVLTLDTNCNIWAMDEDASGDLYAGEYSLSGAGTMQIWKSTDDGATWVQKYVNDTGASNQDHIHDLRVDNSNGYVYAVVGDETPITILRSKDAGENWTAILSSGDQLTTLCFAGGYVYVGTDVPGGTNEIYRFQDTGGESVTPAAVYDYPDAYDTAVYCAGEYGDLVFFGTWDNIKGTCIVTYDGTTWAVPYTNPFSYGQWSGYWAVSRHHASGTFYLSHGEKYGIKFNSNLYVAP